MTPSGTTDASGTLYLLLVLHLPNFTMMSSDGPVFAITQSWQVFLFFCIMSSAFAKKFASSDQFFFFFFSVAQFDSFLLFGISTILTVLMSPDCKKCVNIYEYPWKNT